jgi:hypothetical protein
MKTGAAVVTHAANVVGVGGTVLCLMINLLCLNKKNGLATMTITIPNTKNRKEATPPASVTAQPTFCATVLKRPVKWKT